MGFVEREIERLDSALAQPQTGERMIRIFAARDALKWTTEPQTSATPLDSIDSTPVLLPSTPDTSPATGDCRAAFHPEPS